MPMRSHYKESGKYYIAQNATYIPEIDGELKKYIIALEHGHYFIDYSTNLGLLRHILNIGGIHHYLLCLLYLNQLHKKSQILNKIFGYTQALDNLLNESIILDETFSTITGYYGLQNRGIDQQIIKNFIKETLEEYPMCVEPYEISKVLLNKFGWDAIEDIFFVAAAINVSKTVEWLIIPMHEQDSPDIRLMKILRFCKKRLKEEPFIEFEDLILEIKNIVDYQILEIKINKNMFLNDFIDLIRNYNSLNLPKFSVYDEFSKIENYTKDIVKQITPKIDTKRKVVDFSNDEVFLSSFYFIDSDNENKWIIKYNKTKEAPVWIANFCYTQLKEFGLAGKVLCVKDVVEGFNCGIDTRKCALKQYSKKIANYLPYLFRDQYIYPSPP